TPSG
ncbi:unnamed protein product, partial [Allacma fusca]